MTYVLLKKDKESLAAVVWLCDAFDMHVSLIVSKCLVLPIELT